MKTWLTLMQEWYSRKMSREFAPQEKSLKEKTEEMNEILDESFREVFIMKSNVTPIREGVGIKEESGDYDIKDIILNILERVECLEKKVLELEEQIEELSK